MSRTGANLNPAFHIRLLGLFLTLLLVFIFIVRESSQQDTLHLKTDPFTIDLYHKFGLNQEFKPRSSIVVKPPTYYRGPQTSIINQSPLSDLDIAALKEAGEKGEFYYLRADLREKNQVEPIKTGLTVAKSCALLSSNLEDFIQINLNPVNQFISVNLYTSDQDCVGQTPNELSRKFNTSVIVETGVVGPTPDTATYIKRLEDERKNKLKDGKEDNRSFFAKYWLYIVPAIVILMMFSGPTEQGGR